MDVLRNWKQIWQSQKIKSEIYGEGSADQKTLQRHIEVTGIPSSIRDEVLEDKVGSIFREIGAISMF